MRVIAGIARNTRLVALPGDDVTRPTIDRVKEGMFSAVHFMIEGARVLDLCAGSGQLGIEALSRGAARCVFIDQSRDAVAVILQNLKAAGLMEKASVAQISAESYLAACREQFDLILMDPPYRNGTVAALLPQVARVTAPGGVVMAETEYGASLPEVCGGLTLKKQYKYSTVALARYEADTAF
ncbi:MAG: 16S rRNA (guanine(966)-N(2))-methyltransferase RsmD [Ruthenibacterium sp.]